MSADLLREAAKLMRQDAEREAVLREGDPYYGTESSLFELRMTPAVGLAVAVALSDAAYYYESDEGYTPPPTSSAGRWLAVARAYLGRDS